MINNPNVIEILKKWDFEPTEKNLLYVLERMHYYNAYVLFDYMEYDNFCKILEAHCNYWKKDREKYKYLTKVKYYKHLYIERTGYDYKSGKQPYVSHHLARKYKYTIRDMTDEYVLNCDRYWYQDLKRWCKNNPEGIRTVRKLKLERIV